MNEGLASAELVSQPHCWRKAGALLATSSGSLPSPGERVAVVGCGTSWFMAMAYAGMREQAGLGETDAFAASEMPAGRPYDRIVALTRSGTTTEVIDVLTRERTLRGTPTVTVTAVPDSPIAQVTDAVIDLGFADERSVVQTRFATTALVMLRAHLGHDVDALAQDAETALKQDIDELLAAPQATFLGTGWTVGLAHEAALKAREAAQFWAEAYPSMDYRHGPITIAEPGRLVWSFGPLPQGLAEEVDATGAHLVRSDLDPLAHLVVAQRFAVELAQARGLDPDRPRNLTRSVVLNAG